MKIYTVLAFVLCTWGACLGQSMKKQCLGIHGSSSFVYANSKSYFIQQSIGQASVIYTYEANNHQLRQGFLQALKAALLNNGFDTEIAVTTYPNPFSETLQLDFEETLVDDITISLYHVSGQLLAQESYEPSESLTLQFANIPPGTYLLRGQMRAQTFVTKLIKH